MNIKKIGVIVAVIIIAIVLIAGIIFLGGTKNKTVGIETYVGKTSKDFENEFVENYKDMRKLVKSLSVETVTKNYETFDVLEVFNESYFETKKVAVIGIYEDNTSVYEYHIDDIKYNDDKTAATINYTNKNSGYSGSLTNSWTNCIIVELEGTVTSVNFNEITE